MVEQVKAGNTFSFVLDNIDWEVKVHEMRSDNQNQSVHAVATSLVFDRVSSSHLDDTEPQQSLAETDIKQLVELNVSDFEQQRQTYKMIAANILSEQILAFSFLKTVVSSTYPSLKYAAELKEKSTIVPLTVLLKDEKKYAEIVDVLDQLETWVHEIYAKAGQIPTSDGSIDDEASLTVGTTQGLSASTSRPDQPLSHVHPVADPNDPLANVRVPCYGDQLTRVRLAGAKDLRAGCHSARDRFNHIHPTKVADWHSKWSFLKVSIIGNKILLCQKGIINISCHITELVQ